jgi:predicted acetyltransferase
VYWVLLDDVVVGHCDVRHPLTSKLEKFGGHIGYHVHPDYRNRGIATYALREALKALAAKGETEALVTCAHDNMPSIRVIEKCGGVRIEDSMRRRYLIPVENGDSGTNDG